MGICLGHQLLSLALGASTYKLKFGHHGANHPVMNMENGEVEVTTQNHGFSVDIESLKGIEVTSHKVTHLNLNDRTIEGLEYPEISAFTVQHHPEAGPAAFRKMAVRNLSDPFPPAIVEWFMYSHPSVGKRIRAAEEHLREHPPARGTASSPCSAAPWSSGTSASP